jgi:hypothetical protein
VAEDIRKGRKARKETPKKKELEPVQKQECPLDKGSLSFVDRFGQTKKEIPY